MGHGLDVTYVSGSQSGLFEQTEDHYGEIWYEMDGRKAVDRSTLDGKHLLDYTLGEAVSGRIGVWSKTDSVTYFDQYTVTR